MSTESFHRHLRGTVDHATHIVLARLSPYPRHAFMRLLAIARERSGLLRVPPIRGGRYPTFDALRAIAFFHRAFVAEPEAWTGASDGHPLAAIDSLAQHVFARDRVPRFLASAWFGAESPRDRERRRWYIAHARGRAFRSLSLPIAMTRRMEDVFLHTPDHICVDHALRRAEVIGLGGSDALAAAIVDTHVGSSFERAELWRDAIAWLARHEDALALDEIGPIVDYIRRMEPSLRGRTPRSLRRAMAEWHAQLGRNPAARIGWRPSVWQAFTQRTETHEWWLVELLNGDDLAAEGRALRHCVATYAWSCKHGRSSIWSLRHRSLDETARMRSVLTIEIDPRIATIVQVRGMANRRAAGLPLELVQAWAARERLTFRCDAFRR